MATLYRLQKLSAIACGTASGIAVYLFATTKENNEKIVQNSWTTNTGPSLCAVWDHNWDRREPRSLVEPLKKNATPEAENKYNEALDKVRPKATRHIILVRHGEYYDRGETDADKVLTEVGRRQAKHTGERLKSLKIDWDRMYVSTLTRAQETGRLIAAQLDGVPWENCALIREGAPIPPEPPVGHWKPEPTFFRDGARIEAAFRKYFYRADPAQQNSSYTLIAGHGNVIRYFICRALQFPPEAWLRISLNHGSITWISILPSGRVTLRSLGDSGHIPQEFITHK